MAIVVWGTMCKHTQMFSFGLHHFVLSLFFDTQVLGKFCLVMNCTASMDCKVRWRHTCSFPLSCLVTFSVLLTLDCCCGQMMGKLCSGMVQCGAWCCFDEFNCISVEVLSVIAAQLQSIKAAKNSHSVRYALKSKLLCFIYGR